MLGRRPTQTYGVAWQARLNGGKVKTSICLQNRDLTQKTGNNSVVKAEVILITLGSIQSSPRKGDDCSRESDRSVAPSKSFPLATSSARCNTWTALTNKGSVTEELDEEDEGDEEDEEKDEGCKGRGEGGAEEEEVGQDNEDITNLLEDKESSLERQGVFGCWSENQNSSTLSRHCWDHYL